MSSTEKGAATGAATGAVVGGVIGSRSGSTTKGVILGAVLGVGEGVQVTFDSGILFDADSYELSTAARTNLQSLATSLEDHEGTQVLVVGHTDDTGSDAYNQTLSERRAASARTFLLGAGLEAARVDALGRGESEPLVSNDSAAARQTNRWVEVAIFASEEMQKEMLRKSGG